MASYNDYYDSYDSRPRARSRSRPQPRPADSARSRVKDEAYLSPTVPYAMPTLPQIVGSDEFTDTGISRRSERYSYDDRYSYPSHHSQDPARSKSKARSVQKRRSWPPAPIVESEATSLAKEAKTKQTTGGSNEDEAPSKGVIDQEPIIQDVPEYIEAQKRQSVLQSDSEKGTSAAKGIPSTLR